MKPLKKTAPTTDKTIAKKPAKIAASNSLTKSEVLEFLNSGCLLSSSSSQSIPNAPRIETEDLWIGWGSPTRENSPISGRFSVYSPDFFLEDSNPWWVFPFSRKVSRIDLSQALSEFVLAPSSLIWERPDFNFFESVFHDLQERFDAGLLQKGVPVVFEKTSLDLQSEHLAYFLFNMLAHTQGVPVYLYGLWNAKSEGILGATPEILFSRGREGSLSTAALAGTRFKNSSRLPLLEDPKELEEHRMVVEGIRSSLEGMGTVTVGETRELSLPLLSHLFTPISLEPEPLEPDLSGSSSPHGSLLSSTHFFEDVILRLHPTPALGAFPRKEGMVWLRSFQKRFNRLRMGAPFGAIEESGECRCVVSIRNIQWKDATLYLGAGCGIISASQLDREWSEILGKIQSIKRIFGLEAV